MSEPETRPAHHTPVRPTAASAAGIDGVPSLGVVGAGRAGAALAAAFHAAGVEVDGPAGRGEAPRGEAVLLCVPDGEIPVAAATVAAKRSVSLIGHVSGATTLQALAPAAAGGAELFSIHPLQTFTEGGAPPLAGVGCAIAGSSANALAVAGALARQVGMRPFAIDDRRRASYHAAASIASNFLVTVEAAAETVAARAGFDPAEARAALAPLVRQTVDNWAAGGPRHALTGPVARGDDRTVAAQRAAVGEADPRLLPLFDALVERTRALASASDTLPKPGVFPTPDASPGTIEAAA